MKAYEKVQHHLKPGTVYRREDMLKWSNAVDRHLKEMCDHDVLRKLAGGLYYCPKKTSFGETPPEERDLVKAFLKDNRFLMLNRSDYNSLGVGTTQLYNETVVYNYKRHGVFQLGRQRFHFIKKTFLPKRVTEEFLLVDLLNNLKTLPEETDRVLKFAAKKLKLMDSKKVLHAARDYGYVATKKFVKSVLQDTVH